MSFGPAEKQWNASEGFLQHIIDLTAMITRCWADLHNAGPTGYHVLYRLLTQFYNLCFFLFDEDEREKIGKLLEKIKDFMSVPGGREAAKTWEANREPIEEHLGMAMRELYIALDKDERIFTRSKFKDWKAEVEAEYK